MNFLTDELNALDQHSLRRSLRVVEDMQGARITIDGASLLNFSSNNYLGLARHPVVLEAVTQVLQHWGVGATSSRLISGTTVIHQDLERALAAFLKTEAALAFPTGYMANLGVITALVGPGDAIIMDRLCHASLVDAARLSGARLFVYDHADAADAEKTLERARQYRRRLLVTESLFSMNGDFAPLPALAALARTYGAVSFVDEAHAIGAYGYHGRGVLGSEGMDDHWDIVVGTLSKALGSQGGFAAGSRDLMDVMINKSRSFIFTTGLSPACVAAAGAALSLIQEDAAPRNHLQRLSALLRDGLKAQGWNVLGSSSHIIPILLGEAADALRCAEHLWKAGIYAPAIRPPTVHAGECRIRFSVTAEHTEGDIARLLEVLSQTPSPFSGREL